VNMLSFLFESLSFLSLSIRARGPNSWARFEVLVFLVYFVLVALIMLAGNVLYTYTHIFDFFSQTYELTTHFGAVILPEQFGKAFPFKMDQQWAFNRQKEMGSFVWYNFNITAPSLTLVVLIQVAALCAARFSREEVWIRVLRAVLVIDGLVIFSAYISFTFFSLAAINFIHNLLAISLIPLCVQFLFAMLYSIQSDIVPIYADLPENLVLANIVRIAWVVPPVALIVFMLGLAFSSFFNLPDDATAGLGVILMGIGGGILFFNAACCAIQVVRVAGQYAEDWQVVISKEMGWELSTKKENDDEQAGDEDLAAIDKEVARVTGVTAKGAAATDTMPADQKV